MKPNWTDDQWWVLVVSKSTAFKMSKQSSPWQQNNFLRQQLEAEWGSKGIWYSRQLLSFKIKRQLSWNQKERPCSYILFFLHEVSSWLTKQTSQIPKRVPQFTLRCSKYSNVQLSSQPNSFDTRPQTACVQDGRGRGPQTTLYLS